MSRTAVAESACAVLVCTLLAATLNSGQSGADNPCDPRLIPSKTDPLTYSRRGDRCEGVYFVPVAGSADLSLVAFTEPIGSFPLAADERLYVQWTSGEGTPAVTVRAVSLKSGTYYRMDVRRPEGSDRFEWPADVLARLKLTTADIALTGWIQQTVAGKPQNVYIPLSVAKSAVATRRGQYVALLVPGSEVSELFLTLAALGPDGREETYLKRDEPLRGFYPAERPIAIPIAGLPSAGLYRLRLGAILRGGGSTTTTFIFYYPGMQ